MGTRKCPIDLEETAIEPRLQMDFDMGLVRNLGQSLLSNGVQAMSDLVEFRHLKYIVAVAETANFTRAAERLFLAQPSLSKQIKDLEDEIGFPIFVRNRDGVRITPAGQMIIAYAQEALAARGEIITMARAVHKGEVAPLQARLFALRESRTS